MLWSDSGGIPPDICQSDEDSDVQSSGPSSKDVPPSIGLMLDSLDALNDNPHAGGSDSLSSDSLCPATRAVCGLVAKCIRHKPHSLLSFLLEHNAGSDATMEVLALLLEENRPVVGLVDCEDWVQQVGLILLKAVDSSPFLRRRMKTNSRTFVSLPPNLSIPCLLWTLAKVKVAKETEDSYATSAVLAALSQIACAHGAKDSAMLIEITVECLCSLEGNDTVSVGKWGLELSIVRASSSQIEELINSVGSSWKRQNLSDSYPEVDRYSSLLVEAARAMFRVPSSSIPLWLFGSLLENVSDRDLLPNQKDKHSSLRERKICEATGALLRLGLDEMEVTSKKFSRGQEAQAADTQSSEEVFRRLSPLLMLRRVPHHYFHCLYNASDIFVHVTTNTIQGLATAVALRLDVMDENITSISVSAEERRLSAEIAGLSLPLFAVDADRKLGSDGMHAAPYSFAASVLTPAFSRARPCISANDSKSQQMNQETKKSILRRARAALYALCCHVPIARDDDDGSALFLASSFSFRVLSMMSEHCEDLAQLQRGCIELFALCQESLAHRLVLKGSSQESKVSRSGDLKEVRTGNTKISTAMPAIRRSSSYLDALSEISSTLVYIITDEKSFPFCDQLDLCVEVFGEAPKTCFLNSMILVAQRCNLEDDGLGLFARRVLPPITTWGCGILSTSTAEEPQLLCVAASLQLTFVVITRTKSFSCLASENLKSEKGNSSLEERVSLVHQWAIDAVCHDGSGCGAFVRVPMRKAGLKVVLAILTIDQISSDNNMEGCLSPSSLGETFSALQRLVTIEADKEVLGLARQVLLRLRSHA